ncbi:hypothetical protein [Rhizobium aouanii]|uniref:Uncharacterized protein n=1 Tax=Rhizobium aouanii TaxID=3118145 RepID=A0ABU8CSQ6_9HYPH
MFLDIVHDLVLEYGRRAEQKTRSFPAGWFSSNERNSVHASTTHRGAVVVDVVETAKVLFMSVTIPLDNDSVNAPGAGQGRFPGAPISV